jgi:hypothetical protein
MSLVAVCRFKPSLRALVTSAYEGAGELMGLTARSGVPHSPQNF